VTTTCWSSPPSVIVCRAEATLGAVLGARSSAVERTIKLAD
jgi:hypothetical protein